MECLTDRQIQLYIGKELRPVEQSLVRDHLVVCPGCRGKLDRAQFLEQALRNPRIIEPPPVIEQQVMKQIISRIPRYTSILALIGASLVFIISWIYIYFDFANNSFVRAFQIAGEETSHWISSVVTFISTIFTTVYAGFRASSKLLEVVFDIRVGVEILSLLVVLMAGLGIYLLQRWFSRRSSGQKA